MLRRLLLIILTLIIAIMMNSTCSKAVEQKSPETPDQSQSAAATAIPVPATTAAIAASPAQEPAAAGLETVKLQKPVIEEKAKISVSFAGDCTLGTDTTFSYKASFPQVLADKNNDYAWFFSGVKQIFQSDDLTLVNLETTLTDASKHAKKKFRFKGDPSYAKILKEASVEVVNIANNHTMDYLQKGFNDTLFALEKAGVEYSGREYAPCITVKGVKVAFIGYTAWDMDVREKIRESLKQAKASAQVIIVSLHWGRERVYFPDEEQIALAHFCIDNGADAVIGHHPHVLQSVEFYKQRYIAYSLGNFCFGGNSNPTDKDSMILRNVFELKQGKLIGVEAEIMPCSISSSKNVNDYRPELLHGKEKDRVLAKIKKTGW